MSIILRKIQNDIRTLFPAIDCPRVVVQDPSTVKNSDPSDEGKTFYFDAANMNIMVGSSDWNNKKYDVVHHGSSQIWEGKVLLREADKIHSQAYGTRTGGYQIKKGQWEPGDIIYLQSCVDETGKAMLSRHCTYSCSNYKYME